jgi:CheY-like chemotaxis protein
MSVSMGASVPVVLLVDDNAKLLQALRETARSRSYQIITTTSPEAALEVLRTHPVAVIVVDEVMPKMSGLELLGIVVKEFPAIGRIVLTGHATVELATRAINQVQVHSFLQKPCKASALRDAIKALLNKRPRRAKPLAIEMRLPGCTPARRLRGYLANSHPLPQRSRIASFTPTSIDYILSMRFMASSAAMRSSNHSQVCSAPRCSPNLPWPRESPVIVS